MQPNRPDELARIQAAGGRVVFNNGHRVRGILAMSRALGMATPLDHLFVHPCIEIVVMCTYHLLVSLKLAIYLHARTIFVGCAGLNLPY
jgi:hypothetical protein